MHHLPFLLVANERPLINIDGTLWINIGLWLVLYFVLRGLLFGPMIRLISARESGTAGSRDQAHRLEADARKKEAEYRAAHKAARASAAAERDKIRAEAARKEGEILAQARAKMNTVLDTQRAEIRRQRAVLQTEVRAAVPQISSDIASKVLGREVRV